jgi:hypothetical protein
MISYLSLTAARPRARRRRNRDSPPANRILANSKANWIARRRGPASDPARRAAARGWLSPQAACGGKPLTRCAPTTPPSAGFACSTKSHPDHRSARLAQQKRPAPESLAARGTGLVILPLRKKTRSVSSPGCRPPVLACGELERTRSDQISFGSLAVVAGRRRWAPPQHPLYGAPLALAVASARALDPWLCVPAFRSLDRRWRLIRLRRAGRAVRWKAHLAPGLPLSGHRLVLKRTATWGAHVGSPGRLHWGCSTVRGAF